MRLERDDAKRRADPVGAVAGKVDHGLMAAVHTVEVAHRDRGATLGAVKAGPSGQNAHRPPGQAVRAGARRQSNFRLGANTSASPFSTTVSPTRQRQSRVTRRRPWSMVSTVTSARTVSPGRTGAMNLRLWPR